MEGNFVYDIFLTFSRKNKDAAVRLVQKLRNKGLKIYYTDLSNSPSRNDELEKMNKSRFLIILMSNHFFDSVWKLLETWIYLFTNPKDNFRRFIPVLVEQSNIVEKLRQFSYLEWITEGEDELMRIVAACQLKGKSRSESGFISNRIKTKATLRGHKGFLNGVAITPNGITAVSGSNDTTIRLWNLESKQQIRILEDIPDVITSIDISNDGRWLIAGLMDESIFVCDLKENKSHFLSEHSENVWAVAISRDGKVGISGSSDCSVKVWDIRTGKVLVTFEGHAAPVYGVTISHDNQLVVSGSSDKTIKIWNINEKKCCATLMGHTDVVTDIALTPDCKKILSVSLDSTLRVWDFESAKLVATLEGHTDDIYAVAISSDGRRAVTGSSDKTIRVWDIQQGKTIAVLEGHEGAIYGIAISDDGNTVISGSSDETLRIWDLSGLELLKIGEETIKYTNAKVLLVGDSGVGKTGLAHRLIYDNFKDSISSDGVWATQLRIPLALRHTDTEKEIWLWDFAGQADYRLIHQLYMDETSLAILVFNPQSENPFEGLSQWDRDLHRAAKRPYRKLLVAGRIDRGGLMVSSESIEQYRIEAGYSEYIETSARQGTGCTLLQQSIMKNIPWEDIPWTASPKIFRLLKDEFIHLKDKGKVLLRFSELKQQIEINLPGIPFSADQLRAVVGLLAGPGIVWKLEFGDFVLMQPQIINSYASAVIRTVRAHIEEIGCISEEDLLAGKLDYQDMKRLPQDEEQIILRAMHQTLVGRELCLRERTEQGTLLVFPSYFRRERPELEGHPAPVVTYHFSGALDEIYATLIVRLNYALPFEKSHLWRFAADFKTQSGLRVGLKMVKKAESSAELTIYFDTQVPLETQVLFIKYVHEHLKAKTSDVTRERHYICHECNSPIENRIAVRDRIRRGETDIICANCEKRIQLTDIIEDKFASRDIRSKIRELEKRSQEAIDNESRELILMGHAYVISGEANQIYRQYTNSDHGIDGEIEFKDYEGKATGKRLYLQLKSGDSYLRKKKKDGTEIFRIMKERHADYWRNQGYPVMLVIRTSDNNIRWMNISEYLKERKTKVRNIIFNGVEFSARNILKMREEIIGPPKI